jgi:hypothetical protein
MSQDWTEKAALEISRSLVLDILDEDIVKVADIIRKCHSEHERRDPLNPTLQGVQNEHRICRKA